MIYIYDTCAIYVNSFILTSYTMMMHSTYGRLETA